MEISPFSNAGSTACWVDQPSTHASATVSAPKRTLPSVDRVKTQGSRRMRHGEYGEPVTQGGGSGGHQMTLCPATNRFSAGGCP